MIETEKAKGPSDLTNLSQLAELDPSVSGPQTRREFLRWNPDARRPEFSTEYLAEIDFSDADDVFSSALAERFNSVEDGLLRTGPSGFLIDPSTGEPSFAYSARMDRIADNATEYARVADQIAERNALEPSMTVWNGESGEPVFDRRVKLFSSLLGMASDTFGVVSGLGITITGVGLTAAPEPIISKATGVPLVLFGSSYTLKSITGFGLNAANLMSAIQGDIRQSSYVPSTALEWAVDSLGGSKDMQRLAVAADLGMDLLSMRVDKMALKTTHVLDTSKAALLQRPLTTSVSGELLKVNPTISRFSELGDFVVLPDIGLKVHENAIRPFFYPTDAR